ncbi:MAG: DUF4398 domain-containing protein [Gammaproteobacteria bacterium]|nr:DUF4398 domain-containing protein [Gammaproteobacteria bacterium]MCF6231008.1 DUF4398 domain-containing protein [Gammaproteobacteria bacterium]
MIFKRKSLFLAKNIATYGLVFCCFFALFACAAAPIQEMSDARQAVQAAKTSGVDVQQSKLLELAEDHLKSAELKLQRRWYNSAREDAILARDAALKSQQEIVDVR